ncbi:uncharacterized protein ACNS7B_016626 isoform 2-T2 [Menidia menidia]
MKLNGQIAVVTGAAQGIGKGITDRLLPNGAKVVLLDVNKTAGESLKKVFDHQYGQDRSVFIQCNVESEEQIKGGRHKGDLCGSGAHEQIDRRSGRSCGQHSIHGRPWPTIKLSRLHSYQAWCGWLHSSHGSCILSFGLWDTFQRDLSRSGSNQPLLHNFGKLGAVLPTRWCDKKNMQKREYWTWVTWLRASSSW